MAIQALQQIQKIWPQSLWLYSAGGTLYVMKKKDGDIVMKGGIDKENCGVDDNFIVAKIEIENDGGDW